MTVTEQSSRKVILGAGWANPLTHAYVIESAAHVHVFADAVELVQGVDYTVTNVLNPAGYAVTITNPGSWAPTNWVLDARPPIDQAKDLTAGGTFGAKFEDGLDKLDRRLQRVWDLARRGLKTGLSVAVGDNPYTLPAPAANKLLGWNVAGTDMENFDPIGIGTAMVDNDVTMASDSPLRVPTQHAAKTYVDAAVTALRGGVAAAYDTLVEIAAALPANIMTTRGQLLYRGAASVLALSAGTAGYLLQTNGAGADPAWTGYSQGGTGAATRTWQAKNSDMLSVKDFGAVGDGTTDDTAAIQAAVTEAGVQKRALYVPGGTYKTTSEITLPQRPTRIHGDGPSKSVIVNVTAGSNCFKFVATTGNRDPDDFALIKSVQFANLSIMKNTTDGGVGIWCEWIKNDTNNQVYFSLDNVQVYCDQGTSWSFAKGVYLKNCNGSALNNVIIKGDNSESASGTANPYTMTHAIHYDQDTVGITTGNINHYISNVTTGAAGYGLRVDGWYEGFFITNTSFVQHYIGVYNGGNASLNSVFNMVNCHYDCRFRCIDFTQVFKLQLVNCDLYLSGANVNVAANLSSCQQHKFIGCTFSGSTSANLNADAQCFNSLVEGCQFQSQNFAIVLACTSQGSLIQGNRFLNCDKAITLLSGAGGHKIGVNKYEGTFTSRINDASGTTLNEIVPFKYTRGNTTTGAVFAGAAATQTVTVPIPAGTFIAAPTAAFFTCTTVGEYWTARYDVGASTATSAVFQVQRNVATSIPAGTYSYCAEFSSLA